MPAAVVNRLYTELAKIAGAADVQEKFLSQGAETVGSTPAQFADTIRKELAKWSALVKHLQSQPK